ncbi:MAG: SsrA-binding protein [Deltaproteobacteria bacterium]|nr:SsrA-binding protein [Deltaproteobacteria bacterium]
MNRVLEVNKDLKYRFEIIEKYEAGIELLGYEVKAMKNNKFSIDKAYGRFQKGELFLINMYIKAEGPWRKSETRPRKLLLHKYEIIRIATKVKEKGLTILPYEVYVNSRGLIKVTIALVKGKKIFERREQIKQRDMERKIRSFYRY